MMLEQLGEHKAADILERACIKVISKRMKSMSAGKMGMTTSEVGDAVVAEIAKIAK
jgi:3-isopropylmalate dehydrogenase